MRAYNVAVAALALQVDTKWLDNVLSHHSIAGIEKNRQGIQRQIPPDSLLLLAIAQAMIEGLELPIAQAVRIAHLVQQAGPEIGIGPAITLAIDVTRISRELNSRLADAVEGAAQRPRGRPVAPKRSISPKR